MSLQVQFNGGSIPGDTALKASARSFTARIKQRNVPDNDAATDLERMMDERTRRELFSDMAMQGILASQSQATQRGPARRGDVA